MLRLLQACLPQRGKSKESVDFFQSPFSELELLIEIRVETLNSAEPCTRIRARALRPRFAWMFNDDDG